MLKIIRRYMIREFIEVFALSIILFTALLMMGRIFDVTKLIVVRGVPALKALTLFVYTIPLLMVYTIPMSALLATLVAVGRLNGDMEIIAIQTGGIPPGELLISLLIFSCLIGWVTFYNFNDYAPGKYSKWKDMTTDLAQSRPSALLDEGALIIGNTKIYVSHFDRKTNRLVDVFIYENKKNGWEKTIHAGGALLQSSPERRIFLVLENGQTIQRKRSDTNTLHIQKFSSMRFEIPIEKGKRILKRIKKPKEYTLRQLKELIHNPLTSGRMKGRYGIEFYKKTALPFSVILFVFIAFPLAMGSTRQGKSTGFTISIAIFLIYYMLMNFGETLTMEYHWSALASIWMPNFLMIFVGIFLNWKKGVFK